MSVERVVIEVGITIENRKEADGGLDIGVFKIEASGERSKTATNSVRLTFEQ